MSSRDGREGGSGLLPAGERGKGLPALLLVLVRGDASSSFWPGLAIAASSPSMPKTATYSAPRASLAAQLKRPDRGASALRLSLINQSDLRVLKLVENLVFSS